MGQSDKFNELKAHWYAVLRTHGFEDIERSEETLIRYASYDFARDDRLSILTQIETAIYYQTVTHSIHSLKLTSLESKIWAMHGQGQTRRHIAETLKITEHKVRSVIDKLKAQVFK